MTKKQYGEEAERLAPSLRRIAYSIVHNEQDAQDAVQQRCCPSGRIGKAWNLRGSSPI